MTPRLFVCTTCDRYAAGSTRGAAMLAAVRAVAAGQGVAQMIEPIDCVMSCPRPCGAVLRAGRGGGVVRFAGLVPTDAAALVGFIMARATNAVAAVPAVIGARVAAYIPARH